MTIQAIRDTMRRYGMRLTDSLYSVSVASIIAYSGALLLLAGVGLAVATGVVGVPEFHPR